MQTRDNIKTLAVTGGAGFVGANLLNRMVPAHPEMKFVCLDMLTYAGNLLSLKSVENAPNFEFVKLDLRDFSTVAKHFETSRFDAILHLAAESHVDRSISGPAPFVSTNIDGTFNLLECVRTQKEQGHDIRFVHVSTDEVFGELGATGRFNEDSRYHPNSPYSATKAGADHLVRAYHRTYGLDVVITNSSNNYGPYQHPEKMIPTMILAGLECKPMPVYGDGLQVRDWVHVDDHCAALEKVLFEGGSGETYCIGANQEMKNIDLVKQICAALDELLDKGDHESLITSVEDRPGHDRRYAISPNKIMTELKWKPEHTFDAALQATVKWYLDNPEWIASWQRPGGEAAR